MTKTVLITGMNKAQCTKDFFLNQFLKIVPSHYSLIRCLEDMGFEVEQRPAVLGEDLSKYTHVIAYLHSPNAFCQNLYTGLYAISQREDVILAFDDWQVNQIYTSISRTLEEFENNPDNAFREYLVELQDQKYTEEIYKKYLNEYIKGCRRILAKDQKLLMSAFAGGDMSLMNLGWDLNKIFTFNPNPYHYNRTPDNNFRSGVNTVFGSEVEPEDKLREWNFASLMQGKTKKWLNSQNITWPITMYGQKRGELKSVRLTEDEMCRVYASQWGCLMPGYFHSGSGWWRARPLQVADAGSILVCDSLEGKVYGEMYVNVTADIIEDMDLSQLTQFAKLQKECLYDNHPLDKAVQRAEVGAIL
jgi:hypothetical protein